MSSRFSVATTMINRKRGKKHQAGASVVRSHVKTTLRGQKIHTSVPIKKAQPVPDPFSLPRATSSNPIPPSPSKKRRMDQSPSKKTTVEDDLEEDMEAFGGGVDFEPFNLDDIQEALPSITKSGKVSIVVLL